MEKMTVLEKSWKIAQEYRKITPELLMRKLKINYEYAEQLCIETWKRQHLEAKLHAQKYLESLICDNVCDCLDKGI